MLKSSKSERQVPIEDFFVGPSETVKAWDEILTEIIIPEQMGTYGTAYCKHARRKAMNLPIIGVAVGLALEKDETIRDARIALTVAAPTPSSCPSGRGFFAWKTVDGRDLERSRPDRFFTGLLLAKGQSSKTPNEVHARLLQPRVRGPGAAASAPATDNEDVDGNTAVDWDPVALAGGYELQEQQNGGSWTDVYQGKDTFTRREGLPDGDYCYRARGRGTNQPGLWSNAALRQRRRRDIHADSTSVGR